MTVSVRISRAGQPDRRHGQGAGGGFRAGAARVRRSRRGAGREAQRRRSGRARPRHSTLTENAQPALMAVSLAVMRVLEAEAGVDLKRDAEFVAGHSLGEYSALAAAGAFTSPTRRGCCACAGRAMQKAVPVGAGAMAALIGLEFDDAQARSPPKPRRRRCLRRATTTAAGRSLCRAIRPRSNAPSRLPKPGRQARDAAAGVRAVPLRADAAGGRCDGRGARRRSRCKAPVVPVVANVLARPITDPAEIVQALVEQVTGTVRWRESVAVHGTSRA